MLADNNNVEVEVDAVKVYEKSNQKLRTSTGGIVSVKLEVYESDSPYVLIFIVEFHHQWRLINSINIS